MSFYVESYTDKGNYRKNNQDSVCIMEADTIAGEALMVIVCDGMGGLSKGEVASGSVITRFVDWFEDEFPKQVNAPLDEIIKTWIRIIENLSNRLKKYGAENDLTLGTTFSGMLFFKKQYFWVHVGDSRIYHFKSEKAVQVTPDHTVVAREVARGTMTPEEAARSDKRNKLTQCVGASKYLSPEYGIGNAVAGELFILCSDGFYHRLTAEELSKAHWDKIVAKKDLKNAVKKTALGVIERGEKDNVSVIAVSL